MDSKTDYCLLQPGKLCSESDCDSSKTECCRHCVMYAWLCIRETGMSHMMKCESAVQAERFNVLEQEQVMEGDRTNYVSEDEKTFETNHARINQSHALMVAKVCSHPPYKRKHDETSSCSNQQIKKYLKPIVTPSKSSKQSMSCKITPPQTTSEVNSTRHESVHSHVVTRNSKNNSMEEGSGREQQEEEENAPITEEEETLMILRLKNGDDWVDPDKHCHWCGWRGAECHDIKFGRYLEQCVRRQIHSYKSKHVEIDIEQCEKTYYDTYFHLWEHDEYKKTSGMRMAENVEISLPHCMECGTYWNILQLLYCNDK